MSELCPISWNVIKITNIYLQYNLRNSSDITYYISFSATDFAGRSTTKTSNPVIVDYTQPTKSDEPIYLVGRHITSTREVEAW